MRFSSRKRNAALDRSQSQAKMHLRTGLKLDSAALLDSGWSVCCAHPGGDCICQSTSIGYSSLDQCGVPVCTYTRVSTAMMGRDSPIKKKAVKANPRNGFHLTPSWKPRIRRTTLTSENTRYVEPATQVNEPGTGNFASPLTPARSTPPPAYAP